MRINRCKSLLSRRLATTRPGAVLAHLVLGNGLTRAHTVARLAIGASHDGGGCWGPLGISRNPGPDLNRLDRRDGGHHSGRLVGLTPLQIAQALGVPISTVKAGLRRGLPSSGFT